MRQYKLRPLLTLIQALLHYQVWEVQRVMWQAERLLELMSVLLQRRGCQQPVSSTIFRSVILKGRVQALLNWQRRRSEIEAAAVSLNVGANDGNRCGTRTMFDRVAFFSKALLVAWASVVVFFSQGFIDYGDWEAHVAGGALTLLFSSIAVMLIIGGRPACGNCGERVLDDKGVSQASPVAYVKPFASVSMRALFAGNFLCPHCGARNLVRRS